MQVCVHMSTYVCVDVHVTRLLIARIHLASLWSTAVCIRGDGPALHLYKGPGFIPP